MPAQTHGRVINGFDIFSRNKSVSINYYTGKCSTKKKCEKGVCCGKPLQPFNLKPKSTFRRLQTSQYESRKKASNVVIGRSAAAKRAISKRVCCIRKINVKRKFL